MLDKPYSQNRRASFDYEIVERFNAGLALVGGEVKSIQTGRANIAGATIVIRGAVPYLLGADIPAYQPKNGSPNYDALRARPLLLTKKEIAELHEMTEQKKLTLVPLMLYNKHGLIKLEFGAGKRRKKSDKREAIKKKEVKREIRRSVS